MLRFLLHITVVCLGIFAVVACRSGLDEEQQQGLAVHVSSENYTAREVRATRAATVTDETVNNLTVIFLGSSGQIVSIGSNKVFFYDLKNYTAANPGNVKWKNNDPTTQTLILTEVQHYVMKDVRMFVLANLLSSVRTQISNGSIANIYQLNAAINKTLNANEADDLQPEFLLTGVTESFSWDGATDKDVPVELKRAVAKLDITLHYSWDELAPTIYKGAFTLKDFGANTYVGEHYENKLVVDSEEKELDKTTTATPTSKITFYLNEYDFTRGGVGNKNPYVLLKLKSVQGNGGAAASPTPAGPVNPQDNYYRILLPTIIKRNHHCQLNAFIEKAGSDLPLGATSLRFQLIVNPWTTDQLNLVPARIPVVFDELPNGGSLDVL